MNPSQLLERTPALAGADPAVIRKLAERASVRQLQRGGVLFQAGDEPAFWALIANGLFKLVRRAPHGRSAICALYGPPASLGDLSVLKGVQHGADAVVASASAGVVLVPRQALMECVHQHPSIGLSFAYQAHENQLTLVDKIDVLSAGGVEARLAAALLKLYQQLGDDFEDGTSSIPVSLSRRELADLVSTSVETVIRVMTRWEREGLLATRSSGFILRNLASLSAIAGCQTPIAAE